MLPFSKNFYKKTVLPFKIQIIQSMIGNCDQTKDQFKLFCYVILGKLNVSLHENGIACYTI